MAAGRSGSYRHYEKREFDLKSSSRRKTGDSHNGDDDRLRGPDLRDRLTDRRIRDRDQPLPLHNGHHHHHHRSSVRSDSNSSGGSEHKRSRSRRLVEREPGEVSSGSESPVSEKALILSSPSKKRKLLSPRDRSAERKPTFLPPPPPLPNGFVVPPRPIVIAQCSTEQKTCLSEENVDTDDAPPVYQQRHDDLEPGEMEEDEEIAPARNISASRWADGDDFDDDEQAVPKAKKKRSPQSGEVVSREGSEGALSRPSSSDGEPPKDGHHKDLDANGNVDMDVDGKEDDNVSDNHLSDTDSESGDSGAQTPEPQETPGREQIPERGFNMVQGCRSVDEFERMNKINEGTYGVVYRARDKKTNEIVALKKVKMEKEREGFPLTSLREINILLSLQHPYIVGVKEVVVGSSLDSIFMVMEYMDHDLKALMEVMKQPFSQSEVKCLMLQLLEGVSYLHDNWVLHRDLKTSNLLLNNCGELKICDFGLSRQYGSPLKPYTPLVVTLWYRAPELLLGAKEYSTAIDMWSLGCIMAELLAKDSLFKGKTEFDQLDKIFRILGTPNEKIWPGFAKLPGVKVNFVKQPYNKLREKFPPITSFSGRPTLSEAGFDLLNRLLTYDPVKRITAQDALDHPWFREIPLPKSKEFMPTFPAQNAHDRCKRRIMKSPDPLEEQRRKELQRGELGGGGLFG